MPQQILPGRNTTRDCERHFPFVLDHPVDAPGLIGGVQAILVDFEPFEAGYAGLESIGDLCAVFL